MKLLRFSFQNNTHLGILSEDGQHVIDLNQIVPGLPVDIVALLEIGDEGMEMVAAAQKIATKAVYIPLQEVRLEIPLKKPGKIMLVGLNYRDHAKETGATLPEYPTIFAKFNNALIGPQDAIVIPRVTSMIDWEGEFAFVIGRRGRYITEDQAMEHVAGYLICNDVSARDYQHRVSQWTMGKTFDTFAPIGPWLTTRDEIPDPHNLHIRTLVDGEVVQDSNTSNLIFRVPKLISFLSEAITLEPGDIVSTGTPSGVGHARKPARYLRSGQVCTVEIQGLGSLKNPVVNEG